MANEWHDLADRLEGLGLKLKLHLEQTGTGEVPEALSKLGHAVQEAFQAASNAVKDDAVREDVREAGRLLGDALGNTFTKAGSDVRGAFRKDD